MTGKIIDAHMHIPQWRSWDDRIVFDSIRDYQRDNHIAFIDNMASSSDGSLWKGYELDQSILGAASKRENPTVFSHGCLYIPLDHGQLPPFRFKDQLEEMMEVGLDGVKICDFKPDAYKLFGVDRLMEEYEEYIACCEQYKVHMCWHVADPQTFWDPTQVPESAKRLGWFYGDDTHPTYDQLIGMTYDLLDRHPKLNVTLAHCFFKSFDPDEVAALLQKYPNVTIDLAPAWEMMEGFRAHHEKWYRIFREYSDRFLYATDASMNATPEYTGTRAGGVLRFLSTMDTFSVPGNRVAQGVGLEQTHLERILYQNHERIVGEKPREINKAALKRYMGRYLPLMPDSRNKQMAEEYYRKHLMD